MNILNIFGIIFQGNTFKQSDYYSYASNLDRVYLDYKYILINELNSLRNYFEIPRKQAIKYTLKLRLIATFFLNIKILFFSDKINLSGVITFYPLFFKIYLYI